MVVRILEGDALAVLRTLDSESVQCVVTSPPYFGLRAYGTDPQVWGGDPEHAHDWTDRRYYVESGGGAVKSSEAFSQPGPQNAERIKAARWRNDAICSCGAWRGELGLEPTPALFIEHLLMIFREVKRVLRPDGICFVNLSDSYAGSGYSNHKGTNGAQRDEGGKQAHLHGTGLPPKNLLLIPQRFAIGMQDRGWWVRQEIIWAKKSPMPESVRDRFTRSWEPIWMFAKRDRYFFDQEAVRSVLSPADPAPLGRTVRPGIDVNGGGQGNGAMTQNAAGANMRDVWLLGPESSSLNHYAGFVTELPRRCILAGTSERGACSQCGAPWVRTVDVSYTPHGVSAKSQRKTTFGERSSGDFNQGAIRPQELPYGRASKNVATTGWQPSCACYRTVTHSTIVRDFVREWFGGDDQLYGVWERSARQAGRGRAKEVLLAGLRQDRVEGEAPSAGDGVQEGQHPTALPGRQDDGRQGVRVCPPAGTSDGESERVCAGASSGLGDGEGTRSDPEGTRDPSPEWDSRGQQDGEPDGDAAQAARDLSSRQGSAGATEGSRSRAPSTQGSDDEFLIPYPPRACRVLDPFLGSGTTLLVADRLGRDGIGIELSPAYAEMARKRIAEDAPMVSEPVTVEAYRQPDLFAGIG